MNALADQLLVPALILGALLFFAIKILRRRKRNGGGCAGCGPAKKNHPPD